MGKSCQACGMPLNKKEDFACGDYNANFCAFCTNTDGSVKSCEEIFEGGVQYFMSLLDENRELAEKITRKNMKMEPYWADKKCAILDGDEATDEEFAEVMKGINK